MKKSLLFYLICTLCFSVAISQESKRVLFIGNSYTHVNDLPNLLTNLAQSMNEIIDCESITPGGARFQTHVQNSNVISKLQEGRWDFVVLQGQSQEVAFPDGQFYNEVYPYAKTLDSLAKVYNPNVKVLFYMTWGYRYGDQVNCQYYPPFCTYESMSYRLRTNYCLMANDFSSWTSPVGATWSYLLEHNPDMVLHSSDNSHPSIQGSFLAACSFFTMITDRKVNTNYVPNGMTMDDVTLLQATSNSVVFDSINYWKGITSSLEEIEQTCQEFYAINPNPAIDEVNVFFKQDLNAVKLELIDLNGKMIEEKEVSVKVGQKISLSSYGQKGNFILIVRFNDKVFKSKVVII